LTDHETLHPAAADADKRHATVEQNEQSEETHEQVDNKDVLLTPDGQEIALGITGTMQLDPPGRTSNPNRLASVKYALAGLLYVLTHEQSIQWATMVTLIVLVLGVWLGHCQLIENHDQRPFPRGNLRRCERRKYRDACKHKTMRSSLFTAQTCNFWH
jgi:hypothetical protein